MAINAFDPQRVNPGEDDHEQLVRHWFEAGKPRKFAYANVYWMQITDVQGLCFVPTKPVDFEGKYDESSFKGVLR